MTWVLNTGYAMLLTLLSPLILWRCLRHGRYRRGWPEKLLGRVPKPAGDRPVVWFHAVSVGEVLQLQKLVEDFRRQSGDDFEIVVTTSTDTGFELAASRFPDCTVTWFPLDFSWAVSASLRRIRPVMLVLMELELWPNLLQACRRQGVKTALVNARMSDQSFAGYSRLRRLVQPVFRQFWIVAAQTEQYAERLRQLGTVSERTCVTGSVKFDGVLTDAENPDTRALRSLFGLRDDELVFIAGSTQDPEEQLALAAWHGVQHACPNLRLILVPRHRERFEDVAALVRTSGVPLCRRSCLSPGDHVPANAVILLDTIGELSACWGLADIAFVGGSFGSRGGQNMLEPAAFGAAVMFGPNTRNFRDIVNLLLSHGGAVRLAEEHQLVTELTSLVTDPERRRRLGHAAASVVQQQQGALRATTELLMDAVAEFRPAARHERPAA